MEKENCLLSIGSLRVSFGVFLNKNPVTMNATGFFMN
jgi:hypothetical protein